MSRPPPSSSSRAGHLPENLIMTPAIPDSADSSSPPSPTFWRTALTRTHSSISDERTPLLPSAGRSRIRLQSAAEPPRLLRLSSHQSINGSLRGSRHHSRAGSWGARLVTALKSDRKHMDSMRESKSSIYPDDRVWYDQFTSTDWVHDSIADAHRVKALRSRKDFRGRVKATFDGAQGWILSAVVGIITASIAYVVDVSEAPVFDWKDGYCSSGFLISEKASLPPSHSRCTTPAKAWRAGILHTRLTRQSYFPSVFNLEFYEVLLSEFAAFNCCPDGDRCDAWESWSNFVQIPGVSEKYVEFGIFVCLVVTFSTLSCLLTLTTKTIVPSTYHISTLDENLAATSTQPKVPQDDGTASPVFAPEENLAPPMVYYSAAGSGVAEVRVILSGFVLHGFLGAKTLIIKTLALILSVASGLSLGKEGPFVHIATCVGNIACRLFSKYDNNDGKRREVLSAAAAAGVAVAFGAPIGGVLFCLEEVAYFFPAKTLFRTFFCCITAALTLKFLNPYGTSKVVMFEVRYLTDWEFFEIAAFITVGSLGGATGAIFIKASRSWAKSFRKIPVIKKWPIAEVMLVALITGLVSYWNPYTKIPVAKLLFNLASPCDINKPDDMGLCPADMDEIFPIGVTLAIAFFIKGILTIITFGIKVPAGIYVPSMVVGGLGGRLIGHLIQWTVLRFPTSPIFGNCAAHVTGQSCITPGVYALIAAGSTMCGVTRLSVTLVVILFELTGSLDYVLPFSLAILVSKWTADFMEPLSIYDLLTNLNSYPFLNNKHKPVFTSDLADILPRVRRERLIDISNSPLVSAGSLRRKLEILHQAGEVDGGLPIIRDEVLVGLIPAPDLEYALDNLEDEAETLCLMAKVTSFDDSDDEALSDPTDFSSYIDPAPLALDIQSPMDLVYECFVKLGLRYVCVTREGKYAGMTHKKTFVKYMRELEERDGHM
ncbi:probable chloride channel protein 3 [Rhynchosporium agropyri]|uniref:Probable chloride channel protein 3 n=1 Tax=Rhynchosporium agropyri TaxID=914238 RepID=A0A1E1K9T6_9HELO|nr:probable chloride channel protein 3 [Rhynchosporium agropyri]